MARKWVTRERPKMDRIACPWLIRHFVAEDAEFIYVSTEQVFLFAKDTSAIPYDAPGVEPFSHRGERCSFGAAQRASMARLLSSGSWNATLSRVEVGSRPRKWAR